MHEPLILTDTGQLLYKIPQCLPSDSFSESEHHLNYNVVNHTVNAQNIKIRYKFLIVIDEFLTVSLYQPNEFIS